MKCVFGVHPVLNAPEVLCPPQSTIGSYSTAVYWVHGARPGL